MTKEDYILMYIESPQKLVDFMRWNSESGLTCDNLREVVLELGDPNLAICYSLNFNIFNDNELINLIRKSESDDSITHYFWNLKYHVHKLEKKRKKSKKNID